MNHTHLWLGLAMLGCIAIGWAMARRAPEGIEYRVWLKLTRRFHRSRLLSRPQ